MDIVSPEIKGIRNLFKLIFVLVLLVFFMSSFGARADISHLYVTISCNPTAESVQISSKNVFEGEDPPAGSVMLEAMLGDGKKGITPICNLTQNRRISIKWMFDEGHSREYWYLVYVNDRPMEYTIPILSDLKIIADKENYYVTVTQCIKDGFDHNENPCIVKRITSPNFKCGDHLSAVEDMICHSDELSADDIELARIYNLIIQNKNNKAQIVKQQSIWMSERQKSCEIDKTYKSLYKEKTDCINQLYRSRIEKLYRIFSN